METSALNGIGRARLLVMLLLCASPMTGLRAAAPPGQQHLEGVHASGAHWAVDVPANWNGTLLLYARGYSPSQPERAPDTAPRGLAPLLLVRGYALAASNYSGAGWALQEAPGEPVELQFDLSPTSWLFRRGSRIRITITGAEKNTYQQPDGFDNANPPTLTLHGGGRRDSRVMLPVVPSRC